METYGATEVSICVISATTVRPSGPSSPARGVRHGSAGRAPEHSPRAGRTHREPQAAAARIEPVAPLIALAVLLLLPGASSVIFGLALSLAQAVGLSPSQVFQGYDDFRFWTRLGA